LKLREEVCGCGGGLRSADRKETGCGAGHYLRRLAPEGALLHKARMLGVRRGSTAWPAHLEQVPRAQSHNYSSFATRAMAYCAFNRLKAAASRPVRVASACLQAKTLHKKLAYLP
jgi:hypothetical protein